MKLILNNIATGSLEINFSETVETALSKLFPAVKEGAITEYMCSTLQRSDIHAC